MTAPNRSAQFAKLHKTLKKHYKPVSVNAERPVLEHLVFACLLENAPYAVAEETFAAMLEEYYDWNEIRVSSPRELTETMVRLPDPPAAAARLKRVLQHVFEASYSFDLESLRKKNLGPACDTLAKIYGAAPFAVAYVVQSALGGHSIPLDTGTLEVLRIVDLATEKEVEKRVIAGLERAIPKNKGVEFGSLLHQLGADFVVNPFSSELRNKLLEINPEAKNRWPKRRVGKAAASEKAETSEAESKPDEAATEESKTAAKRKGDAAKKAPAKKKPTVGKSSTSKSKQALPRTKPAGKAKAGKKSSSGLPKRKPR